MGTTNRAILTVGILLTGLLVGCGGGGSGAAPLPVLSIADAGSAEGNTGTTNLIFTVTLDAAAEGAVSADYATADGSAEAGSDYAAASGTVTIPGGATTGTITVAATCDTDCEVDETLTVTLGNPTGVTLGTAVATGTLTNDDAPDSPTLDVSDGGIKTLAFSWSTMPTATHYRLMRDPDGLSGFTQVGGDLSAGTTAYDVAVSVHLTDWVNARYRLEACNAFGCTPSAEIDVADRMLGAIGYGKASLPGTWDVFGSAVALSGDGGTLAVGAPSENGTADDSGAVCVFARTGPTWTQEALLKASNAGVGDGFGISVALSADGDTLAVGAYRESGDGTGIDPTHNDNAPQSGAAYVFTRTGTTWAQQAYVKASNTGGDDQFGIPIALSGDGDTLAVGAAMEDGDATGIGGLDNDGATDSGAVYVFTRTGPTWTQQAYVKASNTGAYDWFGYGVALSEGGDTLAVGAYGEDSDAADIGGAQDNDDAATSGAAYVFARDGTAWSQQAYVKASNAEAGDIFGLSVALSADGDTLAVGAPQEDSDATGIDGADNDDAVDSGAVYVFTRTGTTWIQQAYAKASNPGEGDVFGIAVALSGDGDTLAVGASGEASDAAGVGAADNDDAATSGAVYVFSYAGSAWSPPVYVKSTNPGGWDSVAMLPGDQFGTSVALSYDGGTLAVGAPHEDSDATGFDGPENDDLEFSGAIYLY